MGHQRLGTLPAHRKLPEIVRFLIDGGLPTADLVDEVTDIGHDALKRAAKDPVFIEALWLLARLPQAAGSGAVAEGLAELGFKVLLPGSLAAVLVAFDNALEQVQRHFPSAGNDLGELARQAALSALAETLQRRLPGLWEPTAEDVRHGLALLRSPEGFADLAQRFYSRLVERVIHYFLDRDLHRMIGPERVTKSLHDLDAFNAAIRRHCDEASLIMRGFARDWLGKNLYRDGKMLTRDDLKNFASYASEKLRYELDKRKGMP
jgi:hypothetical protein